MKKILVIEDELSIRKTIADLLMLEGYDYREAANGTEGVKVAKSYVPDLILCDVMMPSLDGYGVLTELHKSPHTEKIPFIFLTAKASKADLRKGMTLGADDYITKPFDPEELLQAIEKRLSKFEMLQNTVSEEVDQLRYYLHTTLPHELRTPLTGIMGYVDWLLTDFDNIPQQDMKKILSSINKSAFRLFRLIENHLLHAQLSAVIREENIGEQITRFGGCETPSSVIEAAAYHIAYKHNRDSDFVVTAENANVAILPDNLQKITEELADNACKFSAPGSTISINGFVQEDEYTLVVQDNGRGMSEEHIAFIGPNRQFERQEYEQQGVGLGLSIVMQITQIYRGLTIIDSETGQGTRITVKIPLLSPNNAA